MDKLSMWKNLAPSIHRQRLIIEGVPEVTVNRRMIDTYLKLLSKVLNMTLVMGPLTRENPRYGYSSYIYWEESGTHFYFWHKPFPFISVDIYSCKKFQPVKAVSFTKKHFRLNKLVWKDISFKK